jgi:hypothetical protein
MLKIVQLWHIREAFEPAWPKIASM